MRVLHRILFLIGVLLFVIAPWLAQVVLGALLFAAWSVLLALAVTVGVAVGYPAVMALLVVALMVAWRA